jgi:hypothetical protein
MKPASTAPDYVEVTNKKQNIPLFNRNKIWGIILMQFAIKINL